MLPDRCAAFATLTGAAHLARQLSASNRRCQDQLLTITKVIASTASVSRVIPITALFRYRQAMLRTKLNEA